MLKDCLRGLSHRTKSGLGPVHLRRAHFGPFRYEMDGPVETVAKLGPFTFLNSNRCVRAVLKWKVAFAEHRFHSPILEWKRNSRLYVKTKLAQRNRTGP